jgi:hypothetical protein
LTLCDALRSLHERRTNKAILRIRVMRIASTCESAWICGRVLMWEVALGFWVGKIGKEPGRGGLDYYKTAIQRAGRSAGIIVKGQVSSPERSAGVIRP